MRITLLHLLILSFSIVSLTEGFAPAQGLETEPTIKRGWFWYEINPPEEKLSEEKPNQDKPDQQKTKKLPSLSDYSLQELWEMHPDQFQAILMELQKKAVMKPTIESVREYYIIQDIARRKALAFANVAATVMQMYPGLSLQAEVPSVVPGINARVRQQINEITSKINASKGDFALLYFYSPYCEFCTEQNQIIDLFRSKYGWKIKAINITVDPAASEKFRINGIPYILLISRLSQESIPISVGVVSLLDMEQRIYRGIRLLNAEIKPEEYSMYEFQRGTGLDPTMPIQTKPINP